MLSGGKLYLNTVCLLHTEEKYQERGKDGTILAAWGDELGRQQKAMVSSILLQSKELHWLKKECGIHIVVNEKLEKERKICGEMRK
jgi:hypothetical protein